MGGTSLNSNQAASYSTAVGFNALKASNAENNTGVGVNALLTNVNGIRNTALGRDSLYSLNGGSYNIGIGMSGGTSLTSGSYNIDIGNFGTSSDNRVVRIGTQNTQTSNLSGGHLSASLLRQPSGGIYR